MNIPGMVNDGLNVPFTGPLLSDMTATENGVAVGQYQLTAKEIQDMETILRTGAVGYAYVYPLGGKLPQTYVFSMTPENMGNFIGKHGRNCHKIVMTDRMDMLILDTYCGLIDKCPDKQLLHDVLQHLMPIQFRQAEPKEFPVVSRESYDRYDSVLEEVRTALTSEDLKQAELSARNTVRHFYQPGINVSLCPYLEAKWIGEKNLCSCKLENTPENLAAFIQQKKAVDEISIRDPQGTELIVAKLGYVHMCLDEAYLKNRLQPALAELRRSGYVPVIQEADTPANADMKMEM